MTPSEIPPPPNPLFFWATKEELNSNKGIISVEEYLYRAYPERELPFSIVKWYNFRITFYLKQWKSMGNPLLTFTEEEWKTLMDYLVPSKVKAGWFDKWEKN